MPIRTRDSSGLELVCIDISIYFRTLFSIKAIAAVLFGQITIKNESFRH